MIDKLHNETIPDYVELLRKDCSGMRGYDRMRSEPILCEMPHRQWKQIFATSNDVTEPEDIE